MSNSLMISISVIFWNFDLTPLMQACCQKQHRESRISHLRIRTLEPLTKRTILPVDSISWIQVMLSHTGDIICTKSLHSCDQVIETLYYQDPLGSTAHHDVISPQASNKKIKKTFFIKIRARSNSSMIRTTKDWDCVCVYVDCVYLVTDAKGKIKPKCPFLC